MLIDNELVLLGVDAGQLTARVIRVPQPEHMNPDEIVRSYLHWDRTGIPEGAFVQSTSWRFVHGENALVITWAVFPDPQPGLAVPVPVFEHRDKAHAAFPAPDREEMNSVGHAAHQIAMLRMDDPNIREALERSPELAKALDAHTPSWFPKQRKGLFRS